MYDSLHRADRNGKLCNYRRLLDRVLRERCKQSRPHIFIIHNTIPINIIVICGVNKEFNIVPNTRIWNNNTSRRKIHYRIIPTILLPDDYVTIKYKSRRGEYATSAHDCCGGRIATFATNITLSVGAMRNAESL